MSGKLSLVSVGPGDLALVPERAQAALREAEVIIGYDLYLTWVRPLLRADQEVLTPPLTQEKHRAELAIQKAAQGKRTALVSSGDIGIYAMAGLVFEELPESPEFAVEVIPGITSATACASLLGSPLTHDFATLSLSDLLCPWEWIAARASHIAQADLACVLYNVQSRARQEGVYRALRLMLEHKRPDTVCGVVRNAYREGQQVDVTTLQELLSQSFDMLTTIVIGNRFTVRKGEWMYTPRGYNDWQPGREQPQASQLQASQPQLSQPHSGQPQSGQSESVQGDLPDHALWVFSGTRDGNELALRAAEAGWSVVLSAASDLGRELAPAHPRLRLYHGPSGQAARRRALASAAAVLDATHPYAGAITAELVAVCAELGRPYLRFERPSLVGLGLVNADTPGVTLVPNMAAAARAAAPYTRVFLATGSKDLESYLRAAATPPYVRLTPQPEVLARARELGVPSSHLCAAVGPFSREWNEAQWRQWDIEAVITKDSGAAGGFQAKYDAARALGLPLIVIERPAPPPSPLSPPNPLSTPSPGAVKNAGASAAQGSAAVLAWLRDLPQHPHGLTPQTSQEKTP